MSMDVITIDFETFYSQEFSLSKLTVEEYVRDSLFEVIGVAVQVNDEEPLWASGPPHMIQEFLDGFEMHKHIVVAHNAMFDMAILNWIFGIIPKRIGDTLSMGRALNPPHQGVSLDNMVKFWEIPGKKGHAVASYKGYRRTHFTEMELAHYGDYCINDVVLTYKLFEKLAPMMPLNELKLIDLTIRMFTEPVLELDRPALISHRNKVVAEKSNLLGKTRWEKTDIMSNPKLATILEQEYEIPPPMKVSPTTGKLTHAFAKTDEGFLKLADHPNPEVQALIAARLGTKSTLEETRTDRFINISKRGKLPIPLRYYAAHTGRWGGQDKINMQNLPRKSPLKDAIRAPAGHSLIHVDSSQIEARVLAWLAGQEDLVAAFAAGEDVYSIMAATIYGKPLADITKDERFVGKTTILGCGYGMGHARFRAQLASDGVQLSEDECKYIIATYRSTYANIPELWGQAQDGLGAIIGGRAAPIGREGVLTIAGKEGIYLPNGLRQQYPDMRWVELEPGERPQYVYHTNRGRKIDLGNGIPVPVTKIYGGMLVENLCQAVARIIVGEQMLKVAKTQQVVMMVHDAIVTIEEDKWADDALAYVMECMGKAPDWAEGLPLACEGGKGKTYGSC